MHNVHRAALAPRWLISTAMVFGLALSTSPAQAQTAVVHAGTLLAVPGERPATGQSIILDGERILRIEPGFTDPASLGEDVALLDFSDQFVLPGLMDMHVHLRGDLSTSRREDVLTLTAETMTLQAQVNGMKTLRAGFTTVRDLGAPPPVIYALRDAIRNGLVQGPRIYAAGSALAATGGHGDVDGYKAELLELWTPDTICDGPVACRQAVRNAVKFGADWIKITATGGVLSDTGTGLNQQMTDDELVQIMETAHALGIKVAAHAHGVDGINASLRAGVDSVDHGTFLNSESVDLFLETGAYWVPTLMPGALLPAQMEGNPFFTPEITEKVKLAVSASEEGFALAYRRGVKIAFGTDSGVTPHGNNAQEFALMVSRGMSEMDAIRSATVVTAELLEVSELLGTLEAGKLADIIAVDGNPLEDITELERVEAVVKGGVLVN
ncbi:MAG: amidohydrolase family protein [Pseudomonadota bacterium]